MIRCKGRHRVNPTARGAAALLILGLAAACANGSAPDHDAIVAEHRDFNRDMASAIEHRDLDGMMSRIWRSPDVIFVGPDGETARGWDEIRTIEERFLGSLESAKLDFEEDSYTISGGTVVAVLTVSLTAVPAGGGPPRTTRVRLTDVRMKKDGRWITIYNHSHSLPES